MGQKGFHPLPLDLSRDSGLEPRVAKTGSRVLHVLPSLIQIICLFALSRLLGPAALGESALAFAFIWVLALLGTPWLDDSQTRLLPLFRASGREAELLSTSLVLALTSSLLLSALGFVLLAATARLLSPVTLATVRTGLLTLPLLALFCPIFSTGTYHSPVVRRLVIAGGVATGVLLMARLRLDSSALFSGPAIIAAIWLLASRGRFRLADPRRFNLALAAHLLRTGIPSALPRLCLPLVALAGGFLVNVLYGGSAVGVYAFGWALALCLVQLSQALPLDEVLSNLPFPVLDRRLNRYVRIALPATVMFFLLSFTLARLALPAVWGNVASVIPWFAASAAGYGFSRYAAAPLLCAGRHGRYLRLMASALGVNLVLCLLLAPMLGVQGAAMAGTLAVAMVCLSLVSAAQEHSAWRFRRTDLVIPATGTMVIFAVHSGLAHFFVTGVRTLLLEILFGGAGYWVACLLADRLAASDLPSQFGQFWRRGATGLLRPFGIRLNPDS